MKHLGAVRLETDLVARANLDDLEKEKAIEVVNGEQKRERKRKRAGKLTRVGSFW